jgi:hypothetical protein
MKWFVSLLVLGAMLAVCGGASAHRNAPMLTVPRLMKRIDGATVRVGSWSGHVESDATLCSGVGRARRWGGVGHWLHFTCTWTTFSSHGGVDRDVTFLVHTMTERRFLITNARFGPD